MKLKIDNWNSKSKLEIGFENEIDNGIQNKI